MFTKSVASGHRHRAATNLPATRLDGAIVEMPNALDVLPAFAFCTISSLSSVPFMTVTIGGPAGPFRQKNFPGRRRNIGWPWPRMTVSPSHQQQLIRITRILDTVILGMAR